LQHKFSHAPQGIAQTRQQPLIPFPQAEQAENIDEHTQPHPLMQYEAISVKLMIWSFFFSHDLIMTCPARLRASEAHLQEGAKTYI
jgi:hypothetical protein